MPARAFEHVLVTTDFSRTSYAAFPLARTMAQTFGARLTCLYALPPPNPFWVGVGAPGPVMPTEEALRAQAQERLRALAAEQLPGLEVRVAVVVGHDYVEILRYAREEGVDLIVMATHGHTGLEHVLIGSTTERVVREAHCPVLTVRAPEAD